MEPDDTTGEPPSGSRSPWAAAGMVLPPAAALFVLFGGWDEAAVRMSSVTAWLSQF
ncbi:hypothetical protein [Streptomyces sp. NPDC026673]|uniref:hypothetical protein n=1 Tax=Streptomyces sp. NPDC026673 TaxID=3155724 RepID=UPI0033EBAB64